MTTSLDLYWLPLGAGAHVVRLSGRAYEAVLALAQRRPRCDLYHAALVAHLPEGRTVLEVAPEWDHPDGAADCGAVVSGAVGAPSLGRSRWFRYEVRRWRDGVIPDLDAAVDSPVRVSEDEDVVRRALAEAAEVPALTWGRDELGTGEMWNSNSVVAWVLTRAGVDVSDLPLPAGGRAPGLGAGIAAATPTRARASTPH